MVLLPIKKLEGKNKITHDLMEILYLGQSNHRKIKGLNLFEKNF